MPYMIKHNFDIQYTKDSPTTICSLIRKLAHAIYRELFHKQKLRILLLLLFNIFALKINCGYTLEPPRRGGSNEYTQSMFWNKIRKIGIPMLTPGFAL